MSNKHSWQSASLCRTMACARHRRSFTCNCFKLHMHCIWKFETETQASHSRPYIKKAVTDVKRKTLNIPGPNEPCISCTALHAAGRPHRSGHQAPHSSWHCCRSRVSFQLCLYRLLRKRRLHSHPSQQAPAPPVPTLPTHLHQDRNSFHVFAVVCLLSIALRVFCSCFEGDKLGNPHVQPYGNPWAIAS